jgi:hypothetical protein
VARTPSTGTTPPAASPNTRAAHDIGDGLGRTPADRDKSIDTDRHPAITRLDGPHPEPRGRELEGLEIDL